MRYRTAVTEEVVGSFHFRLAEIERFEDAVDDMFAELVQRGEEQALETLCPYFGFLWPGGRALARWMAKEGPAFDGKRVLELGCGLALPSFVAARLGADVVASDFHPDGPFFLAQNLRLNAQTSIRFRRVDWNDTTVVGEYDWIVASDVLYEAPQADALARFLQRALTTRGRAAIVDPSRPFGDYFVSALRRGGLHVTVLPLETPSKLILVRKGSP